MTPTEPKPPPEESSEAIEETAPAEGTPEAMAETSTEETPEAMAETPAEETPEAMAETPAEEIPEAMEETPAEETPEATEAIEPTAPAEPMPAASSPGWLRRHGLFAVLCAVAVFALLAAYSNHYDNAFHFDDSHSIQQNLYLRDLGNAPKFFTDANTFSALPENALYRPLLSLSFALDYRLGGGLEPRQFHRTQMVLLVVLGVLLVSFYRRLGDLVQPAAANRYVALFAATLFSIHTANTETVNYISSRSSLLSTLFVVIAFWIYMAWPRARRFGLYLLPVIAGGLVKPLAIMFAPLVFAYVLLLEHEAPLDLRRWAGWRPLFEAFRRSLPALFVGVALFVFVRSMDADSQQHAIVDRSTYLITQPFVWLHYFRLFLLPAGLTADTDLGMFRHWYDTRLFAGLLFLAALAVAVYLLQRRRSLRPAAFGLAWFAIALLPTSSIFPLSESYNEHRIFFPYVGLTLAAAWLAAAAVRRWTAAAESPLGRRWPAVVAGGLALAVTAAHGLGTYERNKVWRTGETLWRDVTEKSPRNGRGQMNYGLALMSRGEYQKALKRFERAEALTPNYSLLQVNLAIVHSRLGRDEVADQRFRRAIRLQPRCASCRFFYGRWLTDKARAPEALGHLRKALEISSSDAGTRTLYTRLLAVLGDRPALAAAAKRTLEIHPGDRIAAAYARGQVPFEVSQETAAAYFALGLELIGRKAWLDAGAVYRHALSLNPSSAVGWNNLGWALGNLGFYREAVPCFRRASELDPTMTVASNNLRWALGKAGQG